MAHGKWIFHSSSEVFVLRGIVVGVGYMGRRHARKLHASERVDLVGVVDPDESTRFTVARELSCKWFPTVRDALAASRTIDFASVSCPTELHLEVGLELLKEGIHCLIEKPLASTSEEAAALVDEAAGRGLVVLPGHIERFNPAIRAVAARRPTIRFISAYRVGPMSFRSVSVDVIKDVMIHDIDLALFLTGADACSVEIVRGVCSPEGINDLASARLCLDGCEVDLTASRLAIARRRKLRMIADEGYFSVDCGRARAVYLNRQRYAEGLKELRVVQVMGDEPKPAEIFRAVGAERIAGEGIGNGMDALMAEIVYFLDKIECTVDRRETTLRAVDGVNALKVTEEIIKKTADSGGAISGVDFRDSSMKMP